MLISGISTFRHNEPAPFLEGDKFANGFCSSLILEKNQPFPAAGKELDLREAKEKIGHKTTIKGYVELLYVIKYGTPELVEETIAEAMEMAKPGGGMTIASGPSCHLSPTRALGRRWEVLTLMLA